MATIWNPIKHDFLVRRSSPYLFLFGLFVKLSLSGGCLEFDGPTENSPEETSC